MASFPRQFILCFFFSYIVTGNNFMSGIKTALGLHDHYLETHNSPFANSVYSTNLATSSFYNVHLKMDQAYLNVVSVDQSVTEFLDVYGISKNCYKCHMQTLVPVVTSNDTNAGRGFIVDTKWPFKVVVKTISNKSCSEEFHFGEGGHYRYKVTDELKHLTCALVVIAEPQNSYIPILVAASILLGLGLLAIFCIWLKRGRLRNIHVSFYSTPHLYSDLGTSTQTDIINTIEPTRKRLLSLDAFRGLSITIMVFVNYGGGGYWFFQHSVWNGLTVADLVFPWFVFIMGVSLALSFHSLMQKNVRKIKILIKIVRRSLILFALGLLINQGMNLNYYRIPGVLQRFAFSYFVVAVLELFVRFPTENSSQLVWWYTIREFVQLWLQWIIMFILLAVYLILTYAVSVPGCPRGYVGPGGIGEGYPESENCTGGMAGYLDRKLFGANHIYNRTTCKELYHNTVPYDPEGALGAITSAFLTFLGLQAGKIIVLHSDNIERERRLIAWALILGFIGIGLCGGTKNTGVIPLNKNLWSLSFVLATGAMAFFLLALFYLAIDDKCWWTGAPLIFPGMNSILVYCGHEILHSFFPFNWQLHPVTHSKKLAMNIWGAGLWVIIAYYCYKIDFFVKI